jgi:hypothetical protein
LGDVVVSSPGYDNSGVFQYDYGHALQGKGFKTTGHLNQPPMAVQTAMNGLKADHDLEKHGIEDAVEKILSKFPKLRTAYQRPDDRSDRLYRPEYLHVGDDSDSCSKNCGNDASNQVERDERSEGDKVKIHHGLIASGNTLVKDACLRDELARKNDVLCFEMEAAGLMNQFPCLVVRGICNYCDTHQNTAWQGYAALTAAAYAGQLLRRIRRGRVDAENKLSESISKGEVARGAIVSYV